MVCQKPRLLLEYYYHYYWGHNLIWTDNIIKSQSYKHTIISLLSIGDKYGSVFLLSPSIIERFVYFFFLYRNTDWTFDFTTKRNMPATKPYERPKDFIDPGAPSKCLWKLGVKNKTPHTQRGMYV